MLERVTSTGGRLTSLVVVFAGGAFVAAATGGEPVDDADTGRADARLSAVLAEEPTIPVLIPHDVPDGYELWPSPASSTPAGDPGATWVYRPVTSGGHEAPVVGVCIVDDGVRDAELSCAPDGHEVIARYDHDGLTAVIVPLGPGSDRVDRAWQELALTSRWQDVDWLAG